MNEVSCRVLGIFFKELANRGLAPELLMQGVPYTLKHIRDNNERIDWSAFVRFMRNVGRYWDDKGLEHLGARFFDYPGMRPFALVARLILSVKDFYRWTTVTHGGGTGKQNFSCIRSQFVDIGPNEIEIELEIPKDYEACREFSIVSKGFLREMPRILGLKQANVQMTQLSSHIVRYRILYPTEGAFLSRLRKGLAWLFTARTVAKEYQEAHRVLSERYKQLADAREMIQRQATQLNVAHSISQIVHRDLDLGKTLETLVRVLTEVAGFASVQIHLRTGLEGQPTTILKTAGSKPQDVVAMELPLAIHGESVGLIRLWPELENKRPEHLQLLEHIAPTVSMAIANALTFTALMDNRQKLERRVEERTKELRDARDNLTDSIYRLTQAQSARDRLFANVSHEFRTPITLILGPLKELYNKAISEDQRNLFATMTRNGQRLLRLINQLLDLSKIEAGKMQLKASPVKLVDFLREIAASYESVAVDKKIKYFFYPEVQELNAYIDTEKIEKVVHNLLSNAFKFTEEGGDVILYLKADQNNHAVIYVKDTGIGIPAAQLDKVFDRFHQVDNSQTRGFEGSGLGMALAKELIELHHGKISVESVECKGTTFTVRLPIGKEHLREEEISESLVVREDKLLSREVIIPADGIITDSDGEDGKPKVTTEQHPLVLIVEDNADMRQYIRKTLAAFYQLTEASNGKEGVKKAQEIIPDLIISDVMMPQMDGYQLCGKIKAHELTSHIPVILLTAKADRESKLSGLEIGADDYLSKPFDADELKLIVRNRIEEKRKMRERFSREITLEPRQITISSLDEKFLQKVLALIETHMEDEDFSIEDFSQEAGYSKMQFYRKIKALAGQTPSVFVRTIRLKRAAELLRKKSDNISQIAYSVGFSSVSYFNKCFKEQFGVTPGQFAEADHSKH